MNEMMKKTNKKIVIENNYGVKIEFVGRKIGSGTNYAKGDKHWDKVEIYRSEDRIYVGVCTFVEYRKVKDITVHISKSEDDLFMLMTLQWTRISGYIKDAFIKAGLKFVEAWESDQ